MAAGIEAKKSALADVFFLLLFFIDGRGSC
jgi:hypothetical protein